MQKIIFEKPDIEQINRHGLIAADMHYHTNHPDSPTRVKDALKHAKQKGFGLAITDHNQISGGIEAYELKTDVLVFDAIEVICGGMVRNLNIKAADLALAFEKGITGGTDGHLLSDLGKVVTCTHAEDVDGFLTDIMQRRSMVIGREKNFVLKCAMGMVILTKFIKYTAPSLKIHYEQNMPRVKRMGERVIRRIKR